MCVYIRTYIYIYTQKGVKHLLLLNIDNFPVDITNIEWIIAFLENANFQFVIYTKKIQSFCWVVFILNKLATFQENP